MWRDGASETMLTQRALGASAASIVDVETQDEAGGARGCAAVNTTMRRTLSKRVATRCWMTQTTSENAGAIVGNSGKCASRLQYPHACM
jgi:hypothetical protein